MKKIKALFMLFAVLLLIMYGVTFIGCSTYDDKSTDGGSTGGNCNITVSVVNAPEDIGTCTFWSWENGGGNYIAGKWDTDRAVMTKSTEDGATIWSYEYTVNPDAGVGVIFVKKTTDAVRFPSNGDDLIIPASEIHDGAKFYISWGDKTVYKSVSECSGLQSVEVTSADGKTIEAKVYNAPSATKDDFSVQDKDGNSISITKVEIQGSSATITLGEGASVDKVPYSVTFSGKTVPAMLKIALIDEIYNASDVADLGLTIDGSNAVFKTWAPLATKVELALYSDSGAKKEVNKIEMTPGEKGVWTYSGSYGNAKYYQYHITNNSTEFHVSDIWHTVAGPDSVASQIASISDAAAVPVDWEEDYTNPFGKNGDEAKLYSDAVIYEMHIRDWSRIENPNSTGKFLDIAKSEEIISHLTDLGVTHVQILPMFDYAQKNDDESYNWGYNPYHYNVPEGRYVTEGYTDGTQAVKEMRTMIQKLHEAGIAVIMDVVYNHTNGTGSGSLYDMTVPEYFYRMNGSAYSDGSGCGNEVATNHKMVKKYVIESLKHWMTDYHINGFRFDLMGLHEKETMKEIYEELSQIDPNVMVYGEPWTAKNSPVEEGMTGAVETTSGYGVGAFDDDFRDAIKGAEYGGFNKGQVQGVFNDEGILLGLCGKSGKNKRNETEKLGLALHYVECHDNYTLFDKLAISYLEKSNYSGDLFTAIGASGLGAVKAQNKLAAAYIFLSQGTAFINGGQEFLRTKQGNENSYASSDAINQIDLSFKTEYSDVYDTYKGLIALRKANPEAFGSNKNAEAETVKDADGKNINGVTKYTTGDFLVYFNATDKAVDITTTGYTKVVDVSSGTPTESETLPATVAAKSFVILKK